MSEKTRLKDTDEILSSLGRKSAGAGQAQPEAAPAELAPQDGSPAARERRGRRPKNSGTPGEMEDGKPLDIGKYDLKAAKEKPTAKNGGKAAGPGAEENGNREEAPERRRVSSTRKAASRAKKAAEPGGKGQSSAGRTAEGPVTGFAIANPEEGRKSAGGAAQAEYRAYEFPRMTREDAGRLQAEARNAAGTDEIREYAFEEFGGQEQDIPERKAEERRGAGFPRLRQAPPPPPEETEEERRRRIYADEESRDLFLKEISSRFEKTFSKKFDETPGEQAVGSPDPERAAAPGAPAGRNTGSDGFWTAPFPARPEENTEGESAFYDPAGDADPIEPEAEAFVSQFADEVRQEEESRSQEFKDTLARKFMRERERYLAELGIAAARDEEERAKAEAPPPQPPEEQPAPPRRRLDIQIQPEMHVNAEDGDTHFPAYRTYNRNGRPYAPAPAETPEEDISSPHPVRGAAGREAAEDSPLRFSPGANPGGKKSSEELLMELAAQAKAAEERLFRISSTGMALSPPPQAAVQARETARKLQAVRRDDPAPQRKRRRFPLKIAIPSAAATLLALGVLAWSGLRWFQGNQPLAPSAQESIPASASQGDYTVYESRDFEGRPQTNVLVKRSGISLKNLEVSNLLVISDAGTQGKVTLQDAVVDGAIHVKSCEVNELDLANVKTPRVIISNSGSAVLLRVSGETEIGAVEIRTAGSVEQAGLAGDALGIQNVVVKAENAGGGLSVTLSGLDLPALSTAGEAVLRFNDTRVGSMVSEGSLSLDGTGRVTNLAVGAEQASNVSAAPLRLQDALRPLSAPVPVPVAAAKPLQVRIRGVSVANLNVKSPGDLSISGDVDIMSVSDHMSVTGSGTIGSLNVTGKFGNARLLIDLSGVKVLSMTCEAEARIDAGGSARIIDLTCNASTYALGNKVSTLRVNNDRVIYENEPDNKIIGQGVRPPETMAENPNLNYSLSTAQDNAVLDATGDEVGTTCGHPRESGGFLRGDGSRSDPFEVLTPAQLAHVSAHPESYFIQTEDIDISDDSAFAGGFQMIASSGTPFSGVYDGQGYAIKSLKIISDKERVGLFAENIGTIRNVHVTSGDISSNLGQGAYVGGIAGINYENGLIVSCSSFAKVTGKNSYVGGIAGYNYDARIRDCYTAAKITGTTGQVGGIVGVNRKGASVAGCYNAGTIEGGESAGGVAGTNEASIVNCYYLEDTAEHGIGTGEGSAAMRTTEELQSSQMVEDLAAGSQDSLWATGSASEGGYPYPILQNLPEIISGE